ncbi:MAG: hypothetical protein Hyperionvirus8_17 [Hyperionvirus sp.]|uniref:Uncharacterized protein n=1 Tax=Hyperionvirus sp. TaxID=2487770 RepID=A0A3G5ACD0_9VIRU|nr:MAG: hypothetical protein Hyperionvirus8_17 [Hyperionvirus sp.]
MKRGNSNNDNKANKRAKGVVSKDGGLWEVLNSIGVGTFVSATGIRNYMMNDPLLDWLDRYYVDLGFGDGVGSVEVKRERGVTNKKEREKLNILFENGNIFEKAVLSELQEKYKGEMVVVGKNWKDVNRESFNKTVEYMRSGVPIIAQAVLFNDSNNSGGMADLLVRSDYLNKIFGREIIDATDHERQVHYRVIDIKWSQLHLCANGKLIRNSDKISAYKGQLAIYNCALGNAQNYFPPSAYILGHGWKYEKHGDKFNGHSCFDLLGEIAFDGFDREVIARTAEAIKWIRDMRENGGKWKLVPPSVEQLYPNMSNSNDTPWGKVKEAIARAIQELTLLWMVGPKNRARGHKNGIFSWSQKECNAKSLGIEGKKIAPVLNKIIQINQSENKLLEPDVILNNDFDWQNAKELNFYVDFETVNGCFLKKPTNVHNNHSESNIIFLIGMGFMDENSEWKFKNFRMRSLSLECEAEIIDAWMAAIDSEIESLELREKRRGRARIFHWGNAEFVSINLANRRNNNKWSEWMNPEKVMWIDFCKIFQNEPIVVKGVFRFKLKDIAKSMYKLKMIQSTWDETSGISDGFVAMVNAIEYYSSNDRSIMTRIESYNETDCKVICEIVNFLRSRQKN